MTRTSSRVIRLCAVLLGAGVVAVPFVPVRAVVTQEMPLTVGSGKARTEEREIGSVRRVSVSGAAKIIVTEGDTEKLTVEADDNLLPLLRSDVRNGTLYLGVKEPYRVQTKKEIRYRLQIRRGAVERIELSGAVEGEVTSWNADRGLLELSGSSRVRVSRLYSRTLLARVSGAAKVKIEDGTVGEQKTEISGAAEYDASRLATRHTRVEASGATRVYVRAEERLDIAASGATHIEYEGKPEVRQELSGACTVRRRD
jgi:hypothetical protein